MPAPIRLWPGVIAGAVLAFFWFAFEFIAPDSVMVLMIGALVSAVAVLVWWLFFSRAPWLERIGAIVLMVVAVIAARRFVHPSIDGANMGMMLPIYSIPLFGVALVAAVVASRRMSAGGRRASILIAVLLTCVGFNLIRTGGVRGMGAELHWRWTPTPEDRLLAVADDVRPESVPVSTTIAAPAPSAAVATSPTDAPTNAGKTSAASSATSVEAKWSGFRGSRRDSVVSGTEIATDWAASRPTELWRKPIGPGWSSFAVQGDHFFTQEQRGEFEVVSAYDLRTGTPVWRHRDKVRFWESNAGAGPRGTPALSYGRVYALGATGILNALDASTGSVIWSRNAASDTGATLPGWGFSGSPLVVGDAVIVATSGRLSAHDSATGQIRWLGPTTRGGGYSSPHRITIDGADQILLLSGAGATSVAPADGKVLWQHDWEGIPILQPAQMPDGDLLIVTADPMGGLGTRRLRVAKGSGGWTVEERWTSRGLKPYFNDFIVHEGHAYGFDGAILACITLEDGTRKWKGGRYGQGQMIAIAQQDVLLVLSEEGELALVKATPDQFTELAKFKAIEGKTWNHPVLVGDVLLVRNGEEMAAFKLALAGR